MIRRLEFLPEFKDDLQTQAVWHDEKSPGLGMAFVRATDAAVEMIIRWPEACPEVRGQVRRKWLTRFPLAVVYLLSADELLILGVMHGAQEFEAWLQRRRPTA